jgi:tetratricopeptide (TPR) repeat protein
MKTFPIISSLVTVLILAGAGCSTPPQVVRTDPEIERNVAVAHGAYTAGSAEKAAIYYQKALQRSRVMDSPSEIARNAYNLAACLAALHSYDAAQACLDEARLEFQRAGIPCRELPLLEAKIARAQGRSQEAVSLARTELKTSKDLNDATQIQWHIMLAELACDQKQATGAEAELAVIGPKQLKACGDDIQAEAALASASIQMLKQNPQAAALQYDIAAGCWQTAGRYSDMVSALGQAGHAYENAGNGPSAADRYYRAARSLFESGQTTQANDLADRALPLAVAAHQPDLQKQVERLKVEIYRQQQKGNAADKKAN